MFANIPAHHIKLAMRMNGDLYGAITWLLNYSKNVKEGFSDIIMSLMDLRHLECAKRHYD